MPLVYWIMRMRRKQIMVHAISARALSCSLADQEQYVCQPSVRDQIVVCALCLAACRQPGVCKLNMPLVCWIYAYAAYENRGACYISTPPLT